MPFNSTTLPGNVFVLVRSIAHATS